MKPRTLAVITGAAFALMLSLSSQWMPVTAQEEIRDAEDLRLQAESGGRSAGNSKIVGVWDVRVTNRDCQTGQPGTTPPLRVMNMFISGGTLIETGGRPTARGPGLGTWQYLGARRYSAVFRFFRYNPDGSFAGTRRVTRTIELSRDGNEFTATAYFEIFDAADNLIDAGCATETATRLE